MIEQVLIGIIFLAALCYLGRIIARNFNPGKKGCAKGCGCDALEPVQKKQFGNVQKTHEQ
jgi:hypothetical protein